MVLNSTSNLYGRELTKEASYSAKAKGGTKQYGIKFPFGEISEGQFLKKASGLELIKSNLRQLLLTTRGERVMLPKFGTNLKNYLMEPLDQALLSRIRVEIAESIYLYAPSVEILKIQVFPLENRIINAGQGLVIKLFCALKEDLNIGFDVKVEIR